MIITNILPKINLYLLTYIYMDRLNKKKLFSNMWLKIRVHFNYLVEILVHLIMPDITCVHNYTGPAIDK